jgi:hypothetical protein
MRSIDKPSARKVTKEPTQDRTPEFNVANAVNDLRQLIAKADALAHAAEDLSDEGTPTDLPALGWRHRRHYDMRATFITLAIDDGADPDVLETRVTHTRKSRSAFDGYNRGLQWERTCAEVSKLRITRGGRSSAAEQPIAAGSGEDSLHFAAVLASGLNQGEKSGLSRSPTP